MSGDSGGTSGGGSGGSGGHSGQSNNSNHSGGQRSACSHHNGGSNPSSQGCSQCQPNLNFGPVVPDGKHHHGQNNHIPGVTYVGPHGCFSGGGDGPHFFIFNTGSSNTGSSGFRPYYPEPPTPKRKRDVLETGTQIERGTENKKVSWDEFTFTRKFIWGLLITLALIAAGALIATGVAAPLGIVMGAVAAKIGLALGIASLIACPLLALQENKWVRIFFFTIAIAASIALIATGIGSFVGAPLLFMLATKALTGLALGLGVPTFISALMSAGKTFLKGVYDSIKKRLCCSTEMDDDRALSSSIPELEKDPVKPVRRLSSPALLSQGLSVSAITPSAPPALLLDGQGTEVFDGPLTSPRPQFLEQKDIISTAPIPLSMSK